MGLIGEHASPEQTLNKSKIIDQFASEWISGQRPSLREFLRAHRSRPDFREIALECAEVDLSQRMKAGDEPWLKELLLVLQGESIDCTLPEIHRFARLEYNARWLRGEPGVRRAEYQDQFPELSEAAGEWTPLWECPACRREMIPLESEDQSEALCPNTNCRFHQSPIAVSHLFGVLPDAADSGLDLREYVFDPQLSKLGEGGMGSVYRTRDPGLGRPLAIKVIAKRLQGHRQGEWRFVQEARITARLEHPNIVPVHNIGRLTGDGPLFYTMKLVPGMTLEERLKQAQTSPETRVRDCLGIFESVCQAVAFAHQKEVIHRDLKPSNIMIGQFGEVQVMDWGLAKQLIPLDPGTSERNEAPLRADDETSTTLQDASRNSDHNLFTRTGQFLGTPLYASPEQVQGKVEAVGKRSDVFALGAILCELMTGAPPWIHPEELKQPGSEDGQPVDGESLQGRIEKRVNGYEQQPGLSRLNALQTSRPKGDHADLDENLLLGHLKKLAINCLQNDPQKRLADAGEVVQRIKTYNEAVQRAAEESLVADVKRRRSRIIAALASLTAVVALVAYIWVLGQNRIIQNEREATVRALINQYADNGNRLRIENQFSLALPWYQEACELARRLSDPKDRSLQHLRLKSTLDQCPRPIHTWFSAYRGENQPIRFSPDGTRIIVFMPNEIVVQNVQDGSRIGSPIRADEKQWFEFAVWAPNNRHILVQVSGKGVQVWDVETGTKEKSVEMQAQTAPLFEMQQTGISPDGRYFLVLYESGAMHLWDLQEEARVTLETRQGGMDGFDGALHAVAAAAFTEDGTELLVLDKSSQVYRWKVTTWEQLKTIHSPLLPNLAWQRSEALGNPEVEENGAVFDPTDPVDPAAPIDLILGGVGGSDDLQRHLQAYPFQEIFPTATISALHHLAAFCDRRKRVWVLDLQTGQLATDMPLQLVPVGGDDPRLWIESLTFSPDGNWLVVSANHVSGLGSSENFQLHLWDLVQAREATVGQTFTTLSQSAATPSICDFSNDGRFLMISESERVRILDLATLNPALPDLHHPVPVSSVRFSADGKRIMTRCGNPEQTIFALPAPPELGSGSLEVEQQAEFAQIQVQIWELPQGNTTSTTLADSQIIKDAQFSADGALAMTLDVDGRLSVWQTHNGRKLSLPEQMPTVTSAGFAEESHRVVVVDGEGTALVWDPYTQDLNKHPALWPANGHSRGEQAYISCGLAEDERWLWIYEEMPTSPILIVDPQQDALDQPDTVPPTLVVYDRNRNEIVFETTNLVETFSVGNDFLLVGSGDEIIFHDLAAQKPSSRQTHPQSAKVRNGGEPGKLPLMSGWCPGPQRFLTIAADNLRFWGAKGEPVEESVHFSTDVYSFSGNGDASLVAVCTEDGGLLVLDTTTAKAAHPRMNGTTGEVWLNRAGDLLAVWAGTGVVIWDVAAGQQLTPALFPGNAPPGASLAKIHFDDRRMIQLIGTLSPNDPWEQMAPPGPTTMFKWDLDAPAVDLEQTGLLSRVLSGHVVDEFGALLPLTFDQRKTAWEEWQSQTTGAALKKAR